MEALDVVGAVVLTDANCESIQVGQVVIHDGMLLRAARYEKCEDCALNDDHWRACICADDLRWIKVQ